MKKLLLILLLLSLALSFASCEGEQSDEKITIVATMFPQYDFARNIACDNAEVELLLDFGADAHSYEPTPMDMIKISKADLFIYTGEDMELWASTVLESADVASAIENGSLYVLDLSKSATLLPMHSHAHEHDEHDEHCEFDTHIWTSPKNAEAMCNAICASLCEIDEGNADTYTANRDAYISSFEPIYAEAEAIKKEFSGETVYFGGSFAFRYLFNEIGLEHISVYEGCSSHAEPSAAVITAIADAIKASGAKYVFYDSQSEKKIADAIANECGVEVLHLHAVHNISREEFEGGYDYASLMLENLQTLRKALSK